MVTFKHSLRTLARVSVRIGSEASIAVMALILLDLLIGTGSSVPVSRTVYAVGAAVLLVAVGVPALLFPFLALIRLIWTVRVMPEGLAGSDSYGRSVFVPWPTITTIASFRVHGLAYLKVSSSGSHRRLALPLFLEDMSRFRELVERFAGETNPLTLRLKAAGT